MSAMESLGSAPMTGPATTLAASVNAHLVTGIPTRDSPCAQGFEDDGTREGLTLFPTTLTIDAMWSMVIEVESTATGLETPTSTQEDYAWPTNESDGLGHHFESGATGYHETSQTIEGIPRTTSPPVAPPMVVVNGDTLRPRPMTSVIIGTVTLIPGGSTAIVSDEPSATRINVDSSGHAVVVIGGSTSTIQIPATIGGQSLLPGGGPITAGSGFHASTISINVAGETIAVISRRTNDDTSNSQQGKLSNSTTSRQWPW
ncbi:hypothetical protein K504DRAFT_454085 [Pleomassaria siparia CBS 279.74]|uniref:Uncharacterized protein n=1 Tax=Pleomassaria siparia CBS 279.74 TaxID=1314801 RepID=A0A6G1KEV1_9PLEO|nr:hypothetical protein K504DRAFT_454085 [Pleomassaria siparia CBS 279.74]